VVVVEVKGQKTEAYKMRMKIFLSKAKEFGVDEFVEVVGMKHTHFDCGSVKFYGYS